MSKHTHGPWKVVGGTEIRGEGAWIVATTDLSECLSKERVEADAVLIASAPSMLYTLRRVESLLTVMDGKNPGYDNAVRSVLLEARAVIAEAEGRKSGPCVPPNESY